MYVTAPSPRLVPFARRASFLLAFAIALLTVATPTKAFGAPPAIRAVSGASQQTTYGANFVKPLTVWVFDSASGRPIPGVRVNFTAAAGIVLGDSSAISDHLGLASVTATGVAIGPSNASAAIEGQPNASVNFDELVVNKAVLTVVPIDLQSTVGVIPDLTEYTIQGLMNGDTEDSAQISGVPVLTTIATENSPDANYAIKGDVGSLTSPKYTFRAGFGALVLRGVGKSARSAVANASPKSPSVQDGSPVVQSAIQPTKVDAPATPHLGVVHKVIVLPSIEVARPAPLLGTAVHQAVAHQSNDTSSNAPAAIVRDGVIRHAAEPAAKMAGEFVQGVRSALPSATQGPVSAKTSRIRKALNPPTPN